MNAFQAVQLRLGASMAIDLGSAATRVALVPDGPFIERSSFPSDDDAISASSALRGGVIADITAAASILQPFVALLTRSAIRRPRAIGCVPGDATADEIETYRYTASLAGLRDVVVVREPHAAAIGAGLELAAAYAQMLVDIGDGVTDLAIFRGGETIASASLRTGCSDMRRAIADYVEREHAMVIGRREAERLLEAYNRNADNAVLRITGNGPVAVEAIGDAVSDVERQIAEFVQTAVRGLKSNVAVEVIESGVCLTGGGSLLPRLVERLTSATRLSYRVADEPLRCVVRGARALARGGKKSGLWKHAPKTCVCHGDN